MKPVVVTVSIPATILSCQVQQEADLAEGPAADVPELAALHHYAGQWQDEISGRPGVRRTEVGEWILLGRFLRQTWSTESSDGAPPAHGITLMTYDTESQAYRSWSFLATGSVIENGGIWDSASRTFTWAHQLPSTSEFVSTKASFEEEGRLSWSIVKTDAHGKVVREVAGRSIRFGAPALAAR